MPAEHPDLADLLQRVSQRDEAAFQALYDRTCSKLYGTILRIVRSRDLADEVLQDAFLRIWQHSARYAPESGRPMTWMIAIARYAAIDVVRRRPPDPSTDGIEVPEAGHDPERRVLMEDQLGRCLGRLASPQLECVVLAYCNGYSREELASHFSTRVPTVKTWLHRALNALRQCLEGSA